MLHLSPSELDFIIDNIPQKESLLSLSKENKNTIFIMALIFIIPIGYKILFRITLGFHNPMLQKSWMKRFRSHPNFFYSTLQIFPLFPHLPSMVVFGI